MSGSKTVVTIGMMLIASLLVSCAGGGPGGSGFSTYRDGLFKGEDHLLNGEYQPAIDEFLRANGGDPTQPMPLALAGQAAYNMGDLAQASRYLSQALAVKSDSNAYVIVKGYQALIAFKENRRREGLEALGEYVRAYRVSYPENTYFDVERMYKTEDIVLPELERMLTDQIARYEKELFEFF